jgi:hypothetical protein
MDLHEVILTRGDIPKAKQGLIMVPENCALVHRGDCHKMAATSEGQRRCILDLLKHEGLQRMEWWLDVMSLELKGTQAQTALKRVRAIHNQEVLEHEQESG